MSDNLRELAEAASVAAAYVGDWYDHVALIDDCIAVNDIDAAYISAARPDVVLGLLDERDDALQAAEVEASCKRHAEAERDQWKRVADSRKEVITAVVKHRDHYRDAVRRLAEYLENIQWNTRQDVIRWDCEAALADPVVREVMEGG